MVVPLVYRDRGNGFSWQALATKYDLSIKEVRTICQRPYYKAKIGKKK
jgi:Mor family transcriptional regulator